MDQIIYESGTWGWNEPALGRIFSDCPIVSRRTRTRPRN